MPFSSGKWILGTIIMRWYTGKVIITEGIEIGEKKGREAERKKAEQEKREMARKIKVKGLGVGEIADMTISLNDYYQVGKVSLTIK